MYQGIAETEKESFSLDLMQLEQAFCDAFDFDYNSSDNWEREYIYENLFWPLLGQFESRVEMLAEKALKESKMYRIEWED